jgi:hypothetical protein
MPGRLWPFARLGLKSARLRQQGFTFYDRSVRREWSFKAAIVASTVLVVAGLSCAILARNDRAGRLAFQIGRALPRALGSEPSRALIDAKWQRWRQRWIEETRRTHRKNYDAADPRMKRLLTYAGLDPEHAVIRWGNYDWTLLLPSTVFASDDTGRSYRLRPRLRSVWLRGVELAAGTTGFFLMPDTPELPGLIEGTGASIQPGSVQTTNSWGLRGPEPDLTAPLRGLVLGDSNTQGMLIGDDETPVACLARELSQRLQARVALLNTGHIGYSPEQHYFTLLEYSDRFQPHFVLLTLCMNDFGGMTLTPKGLEEGKYWVDRIERYCRARGIACYVASFPHEAQVTGLRREKSLPGEFSEPCQFSGLLYCNPVEDIADAHLRLKIKLGTQGESTTGSPLYNGRFGDNHFSAQGAEVWAQAVGQRVSLLILNDNVIINNNIIINNGHRETPAGGQ